MDQSPPAVSNPSVAAAPAEPLPQRVAVIAIHGVGDPQPGATAEAVARLLVAQAGYSHQGHDTWLLPVQPVFPTSQAAPPVTSLTGFSSPFVEARANRSSVVDTDPHKDLGDLGQQLNYHLLRGTKLPETDKTYTAHRHHLVKNGRQADVIDMFWGDLSGLDGAVTRIAAELFTLIFHLGQLGRDTVQHTAQFISQVQTKGLDLFLALVLARAHQTADTLFAKPNGILNALLAVLALWWYPLSQLHGAWADIPGTVAGPQWRGLALGALAVLASLLLAGAWYWRGLKAAMLSVLASLLLALAWGVSGLPDGSLVFRHLVAAVWALPLLALYVVFLRYTEPLVRGVCRWGAWLGLYVVAAFALGVWRADWPRTNLPVAATAAETWAYATLSGLEAIALALLMVWVLLALACINLAVSGGWLKYRKQQDAEQNAAVARGVDTGRIGLFVSVALYITVISAAWAVVVEPLQNSFPGIDYRPWMESLGTGKAVAFVAARFHDSTFMFTPVLALLLFMLLGLIALLVPSVVAEVVAPRPGKDGHALGRWLSSVGTRITWLASKLVVLSVFLLALWAVMGFAPAWLANLPIDIPKWFAKLGQNSDGVLHFITYLVAGSAASMLVIGARVFGSLRDIRLGLDTALDVDRHFREFPDQATPRGRIAARFLSLLEATRGAGYQRIVVCAHSQGTVIVADLLRDLQLRDPGNQRGLPPIYLFTCGSPLRQLYAARFPVLYQWVQRPLPLPLPPTPMPTQTVQVASTAPVDPTAPEASGPNANELGVLRWTNVYSTGDYVGRWLWQPADSDLLATQINWDDNIHRQICLGEGAHTHYYDTRRDTVAQEIDHLI